MSHCQLCKEDTNASVIFTDDEGSILMCAAHALLCEDQGTIEFIPMGIGDLCKMSTEDITDVAMSIIRNAYTSDLFWAVISVLTVRYAATCNMTTRALPAAGQTCAPWTAEEFWDWYSSDDADRTQPLYEDQSMANRRRIFGD